MDRNGQYILIIHLKKTTKHNGPFKIINDLPDNFLVMNGDILTNDFRKFYSDHIKHNKIFTISSFDRKELVDYGVLETKNQILMKLEEKPVKSYEVSMGIYMMSKEALDYIPSDKEFGLMIYVVIIKKE